ncbi:MAG: SCO family protein [Balneolaceae bacterium]
MAQDHHHETLQAGSVHKDQSIYHLNAEWTDQREESLALEDFMGNPVMVVMFYGNCTDVCPILIQDAWRVFSQLSEQARNRVKVLAVTFDPENDTPEVLYEYAEYEQLNREEWHFMTSDKSSIRELAMLLGVQYRERSDGMFEHSNLITVLDEEGRISHRIEGLGQSVEEAVAVIEEITGQEPDS